MYKNTVARELKKTQKVAQFAVFVVVLSITMCSLDVNIIVVRTIYCLRQGTGATPSLGIALYHLQRVQFGLSTYNLYSTVENDGQEQQQTW